MTEAKDTVEAVRAQHAIALKLIADLHAAYGKGVEMSIDTVSPSGRNDSTWLHLHAQESYTAGFWDDGDVFDSSDEDVTQGGHLIILEHARAFLHQFGYGAR